jgi:hypothetical protein
MGLPAQCPRGARPLRGVLPSLPVTRYGRERYGRATMTYPGTDARRARTRSDDVPAFGSNELGSCGVLGRGSPSTWRTCSPQCGIIASVGYREPGPRWGPACRGSTRPDGTRSVTTGPECSGTERIHRRRVRTVQLVFPVVVRCCGCPLRIPSGSPRHRDQHVPTTHQRSPHRRCAWCFAQP